MREHQRAEFAEVATLIPDRISTASFGHATSGKTEFGVTMPDPIGFIPLDRKTRRTVLKANLKYQKKILWPKEDFVRHEKPMQLALMSVDQSIDYYTKHVNRVKDAIFTLAERKDVKSVVIDSGTQLWEDILFSHFGRAQRIMPRDRGAPNQDMRDILNSLQDKHLLITHQASEIWKNDKPTGRFEWRGFSTIDYYVANVIEHVGPPDSKEFKLIVRQCQDQPDLTGEEILTDEMITFENFALNIYPEGEF